MIPNKFSISLWSPLLQHIQTSHPDFPLVFCKCFVSLLTGTKSSVGRDLSYDVYIACWVMWAVETWQAVSSGYFNLRREVLSHLLREVGCYPSHRVPTYGYWLLSFQGAFTDVLVPEPFPFSKSYPLVDQNLKR